MAISRLLGILLLAAGLTYLASNYRIEAQVGGGGISLIPITTLAATDNFAATITTGLTFQQLLPGSQGRRSLTIQNNQISGTDVCYLIFGTNVTGQITAGTTTTSSNITIQGNTVTAGDASLILNPGQPFARYFPYIPADVIYVTCSTTGDSVYVDIQ